MAEKEVRLIDANEVHRLIDKNLDINKGNGCSLSETLVREIVDSTPTIDPESLRSQWISVKDRLPYDSDESVLVIANGKFRNITLDKAFELACYYKDDGWVLESYPDMENVRVTHWMPLPEPPKEA